MATANTDLWPDDIDVEVLTPLVILRTQEGKLAEKTKGILQAKLTTIAIDQVVQHDLDLIAPALKYRERLLSASHDRMLIYPVRVTSTAFEPNISRRFSPLQQAMLANPGQTQRTAATAEEFINLIRQVLRSDEVRALIQSLIARSNEVNEGATELTSPSE